MKPRYVVWKTSMNTVTRALSRSRTSATMNSPCITLNRMKETTVAPDTKTMIMHVALIIKIRSLPRQSKVVDDFLKTIRRTFKRVQMKTIRALNMNVNPSTSSLLKLRSMFGSSRAIDVKLCSSSL